MASFASIELDAIGQRARATCPARLPMVVRHLPMIGNVGGDEGARVFGGVLANGKKRSPACIVPHARRTEVAAHLGTRDHDYVDLSVYGGTQSHSEIGHCWIGGVDRRVAVENEDGLPDGYAVGQFVKVLLALRMDHELPRAACPRSRRCRRPKKPVGLRRSRPCRHQSNKTARLHRWPSE